MSPEQLASETQEYLQRVDRARESIADNMASLWPFLICRQCGRTQLLTKDEIKEYLATGWPVHCGETMELRR